MNFCSAYYLTCIHNLYRDTDQNKMPKQIPYIGILKEKNVYFLKNRPKVLASYLDSKLFALQNESQKNQVLN